MAFIIVYIFCIVIYFRSTKGSMSRLFSLFFIASITGYMLLYRHDYFDVIDIFHAIWICITIGAVVLPWKNFKGINEIVVENESKIDRLGTIMFVICIILDISCGILSYYVLTTITDINRFKYVDGTTDFYYSLGIDLHGFLLTTLLYPVGYMLVPFVFYYLSRGNKTKALFSFLGSMLPVFYGLTYFSRSHMTHFAMVYFAAFFLLRHVLGENQKKSVKRIMIVFGLAIVVGFSAISVSRFDDQSYSTGRRNVSSRLENTTVISAVDYFSQWWPNSEELFRRYDYETMNNAILFQDVNNFFSVITFGLIPNHSKERAIKREMVFKGYSNAFVGVGAYVLVDQGPFLGMILYVLYIYLVRRHRPRKHAITMNSLIFIIPLMIIPLFAIFYSVFNTALLMMVFYIPMQLYLRGKTD